jgi:DNA replication protein DnaC
MIHDLHGLCDALKLRYTRKAIEDVLRQAQRGKPSYSQFLRDLLSRELEDKRRRPIANRIQHSGLTDYWTLDSFPWHIQKSLARQRKVIEELSELDFLDRGESVVFVGKAGVGKSGLASGILLKALYAGRTARCIKAQNLFDEFERSQADRSTKRLIKRLSSVDLLLVDEFGYVQARTTPQINQLFRLIDNRASCKSTIITTNRLCGAPHNKFNAESIFMRRGRLSKRTITQSFQAAPAILRP